MNKKQAMNEGLSFTGIYSWNKETVQQRIKEERQKRPKARIILISEDNGYSAYADDKYQAYNVLENTTRIIESVANRLECAKKKYEEECNDINNNYNASLARKEEAEKLLELAE